jgi:hypothetical protein
MESSEPIPEAIDSLKTRFRKAHRKVRVEKGPSRNKRKTARQGGREEKEGGKNQGDPREFIDQGLNCLPDPYC